MSRKTISLLTPIGVRGLKCLEREKFLRNIKVPVVIRVPSNKLSEVTQICKPYFLKLHNFKVVQSQKNCDGGVSLKCIYLNPDKVTKWTDLNEDDRASLTQLGIDDTYLDATEIQLSYENWSYEAIFNAVLPEDLEKISGFSQIGHIIHLNLRDHLLEYKSLIGQVLLDKVKLCKTVVNKSNNIDNVYRNFSMEVIAGEEKFMVTVSESRCKFQFDFSKVYWNPRLSTEHENILKMLTPNDTLFDVFCGVGPFAIPAAKRKTKVFANDLNPESFKWLNHNAKLNKVKDIYFNSYNMDGKDFICSIFKDYILKCSVPIEDTEQEYKIHVVMNLPALAVEFIKYFKGLIHNPENKYNIFKEILVHVYCFTGVEDPENTAKSLVSEHMGVDMSEYVLNVFNVRDVSPKKVMMRVTFKLTEDILFDSSDSYEPLTKRKCLE